MLGRDLSKLLSHCKIQVTQFTERNVLLHAGGREGRGKERNDDPHHTWGIGHTYIILEKLILMGTNLVA